MTTRRQDRQLSWPFFGLIRQVLPGSRDASDCHKYSRRFLCPDHMQFFDEDDDKMMKHCYNPEETSSRCLVRGKAEADEVADYFHPSLHLYHCNRPFYRRPFTSSFWKEKSKLQLVFLVIDQSTLRSDQLKLKKKKRFKRSMSFYSSSMIKR